MSYYSRDMSGSTHSKATRGDARDISIVGFGKMLFEVGRDENAGEYALIVAKPGHRAINESMLRSKKTWSRTYQALATVMAVISGVPDRRPAKPFDAILVQSDE